MQHDSAIAAFRIEPAQPGPGAFATVITTTGTIRAGVRMRVQD